ncbi:ribosome small subunit-dependent GTPase A [Bacillus sp. RG28]|uniref:Small ribosomal subunit biogenesis GTPase RsgA n=1 Tax=Gottfriedia endophytica TaxID=2820819 RepID=A0A940SJW5_9BACI|nr:ribosome small subunit-dependent GTPase A [Gottfriedia endophytica]MBP0725881.1 ribosome small subunit-dependent GTPase A [Gottfriedia endophytica]
MNIEQLGWREEYGIIEDQYEVARVISEQRKLYKLHNGDSELVGEVSGKFEFEAKMKSEFPAVGDWVLIEKLASEQKAIIKKVLPRISQFSRQAAGGKTEEQIVAANIDFVFIVMALNNDFNIRRLERYLLVAYESGANPIIILTKKDLCLDLDEKLQLVDEIAFGVPIYSVNSLDGEGISEIRDLITEGKTVSLLGSSGVGKSTLLNALLGDQIQITQGVREGDDRGKHTTTHRQLFFLPDHGMVIDTPGMRELQLWSGENHLDSTFSDIDELANQCKFSDCQHKNEPGCAVQKAIEENRLDAQRLTSYRKLQRELAYAERKQDASLARVQKEKWKKVHKLMNSKQYK